MKEKNELSMRVICYYYSLYNLQTKYESLLDNPVKTKLEK